MLTVVGDVHGKTPEYAKIVSKCTYSIQLGDFGFLPAWTWLKNSDIDPNSHKVLRGNHDYPAADYPHDLGNYGTTKLGGSEFWYMRGAWSIDQAIRTPMVNWWEEEELSSEQMNQAIDNYTDIKPDIVITHDCPRQIKNGLVRGIVTDHTSGCLEICLSSHVPKLWVFGHHHISYKADYQGCNFRCLRELERLTI